MRGEYLDMSATTSDETLQITYPEGFDMSGDWVLTVAESETATEPLLTITLDVSGQVVSHDFDVRDLLDLIPQTDTDDGPLYTASVWRGPYSIYQDETLRFRGDFTVAKTTYEPVGS